MVNSRAQQKRKKQQRHGKKHRFLICAFNLPLFACSFLLVFYFDELQHIGWLADKPITWMCMQRLTRSNCSTWTNRYTYEERSKKATKNKMKNGFSLYSRKNRILLRFFRFGVNKCDYSIKIFHELFSLLFTIPHFEIVNGHISIWMIATIQLMSTEWEEKNWNVMDNLPWPLLTVLPFVNNIWLSSSWSSDLSSANLLLLFFTIDATSDSDRRSVVTSRNFSAPSLI